MLKYQLNKCNYKSSPATFDKVESGKAVGAWTEYQTQFNAEYDAQKHNGAHWVVCGSPAADHAFLGVIDLDIITREKLEKDKESGKGKYDQLPTDVYQKIMDGSNEFTPIEELLASFLVEFGLPADTYVVRTQSGGFHVYLWATNGTKSLCNATTLGDEGRFIENLAVDFRGQGGLVYGVGTQWKDSPYPYAPYQGTEQDIKPTDGWRILWAIGKLRHYVKGVWIGNFLNGSVNLHAQKFKGTKEFIIWREAMFVLKGFGYDPRGVQKAFSSIPGYDAKKSEAQIHAFWNKEEQEKRRGASKAKVANIADESSSVIQITESKQKPSGESADGEESIGIQDFVIEHIRRNRMWGFNWRETKTYKDETIPKAEGFIVTGFRIIRRGYFNNNFYYLCRNRNTGWEVNDAAQITRHLTDNGATQAIAAKIKNWLSTTTELKRVKVVSGYGLDQKTLSQIYLPPRVVSASARGYGDILIGNFYNCKDDAENEEARLAFLNVYDAAIQGIGLINATIIVAHALASLCKEKICEEWDIFPILHLIGPHDGGKSKAVSYLSNLPHLRESEMVENAETVSSPAVLSQVSSAGFFPLGIDEGRDPKTFERVISIILQSATSPVSRKRLFSDGSKRDAAPFLRALLILSNHEIQILRDVETQDRIIRLECNVRPQNKVEWHDAARQFRACKASILSYIAGLIRNNKFPDLTKYMEMAEDNAVGRAEMATIDPSSRSIRKCYVIFFGMYILQNVLNCAILESVFEDVFKTVTNSLACSVTSNANAVMDALATMKRRYDAWESDKEALKLLKKSASESEMPSDPTMNLSTLRNRMRGYEKEGMVCCMQNENEVMCYAVFDAIIPRLKHEMRETNFICNSKKELKDIFNVFGVTVENKLCRIPWLQRREWCYLIPVELDLIPEP